MRTRSQGRHDDAVNPEPRVDDEPLVIDGLSVEFRAADGGTQAVRDLHASLHAGRVVGVAGESGSGKTTLALAAMGLLPAGARVTGSIRYGSVELLSLREKQLRKYRGRHIGMVFQETATALNPLMRVGDQLLMAMRAHVRGDKTELRARVVSALADVRLNDSDRILGSYPHELSGGQCQRIMIAMALGCGSRVLFADEPTTALDVSVQQEILQLLRELVRERRLAVMMISHDLAVLAEICDELLVMYRGEIVESGPIQEILSRPSHPYTRALLDCVPQLHGDRAPLPELPPSNPAEDAAGGCRFRSRCDFAVEACRRAPALAPVQPAGAVRARCWRSGELRAHGGDGLRAIDEQLEQQRA
ncbi:MAG TPA: ABC transporter ATP-binding protein [Solirubrobacteraceae bacterium]|jgi:oligopeptide/dipeptide ABC transporter ATP-binding protein|nr:ABC transporter ATP-binding protein [Solirubrobacteraceae bacterium]